VDPRADLEVVKKRRAQPTHRNNHTILAPQIT